ncbi:exonuclease domain-containing protein [Streptomyces sp. H27-G5]|uniref:exonuclease domain-containing protein n=1 Tax=Streptomyces sp. H27-G5 TaxID=2996698 RepID=UPI002270A4C7|nr:exonuclease domain-containing protein [Streptomyces sp. H27-G5]MCY0917037.1 exonuclease domain-containing protein [Streptomyces sp. H27-G5]
MSVPLAHFRDVRRIGFDTETTGTDPHEARIVTAALVSRGGEAGDETRTWLINPGVPIPPETTAIHGVDDARAAAEGEDPKTALDLIASTLALVLRAGVPVVAFNASYDWTVLHFELERHGLPTVVDRIGDCTPALLDPHVIDRQVDRYVKGSGMRKLKPTATRYGVKLTDWHRAEADALAALLIVEAQFERYPALHAMGPVQLYAAQKAWRAEQQAGLQAYFRRTDPTAEVRGEWPLIPRQRTGDTL